MTKEEFIIQYALQNKEMPSEKLLAQMQEAKVFSDSEGMQTGTVKEKEENVAVKEVDDIEIYPDCQAVCNQCFCLNPYIFMPRGFVCHICSIKNKAENKQAVRIKIKTMKGDVEKFVSNTVILDKSLIKKYLKPVKPETKYSIVFKRSKTIVINGKKTSCYEYTVDENSLMHHRYEKLKQNYENE